MSSIKKIKCYIAKAINCVGKVPLCNRCKDRAPVIFGFVFLLCWRCTGVIFGFLLLICFDFKINQSYFFRLILIIPLIIDGYFSYYTDGYKSNNFKRLVTGMLFSFGLY